MVDPAASEKIATDAFLCLWDNAGSLAPGVSVRSFLLEQTRRASSTGVGMHLSELGATEDLVEDTGAPGPSSGDPALHADERRALELALQGMKYKEITQLLGAPPEAVMEWLNSGLKKLSE